MFFNFYYCERVQQIRIAHLLGCQLMYSTACLPVHSSHSPQSLLLPTPSLVHPPKSCWHRLTAALLTSLTRGLYLQLTPSGLFAQRRCQGRIYWSGPRLPNGRTHGKLERNVVEQLFDTRSFIAEVEMFREGGPEPQFKIVLCFCEELGEDTPRKKLVTAHVSDRASDIHRLMHFLFYSEVTFIAVFIAPFKRV
uniref:Interferon regulatory factor-3 domain-containing protein n=1 Tax=Eptatretus burgeri TaxID=7764 RepID=A0A8C4QDG2_EPTBU